MSNEVQMSNKIQRLSTKVNLKVIYYKPKALGFRTPLAFEF
jgi:hypothetical protein